MRAVLSSTVAKWNEVAADVGDAVLVWLADVDQHVILSGIAPALSS